MVIELTLKPDNSELSTMQLFQEALSAEYIETIDNDGYRLCGWRISDIQFENGRFLHDLIKWNFINGVWEENLKQCLYLDSIFERKAIKAGYIVDDSKNRGLYLGLTYHLTTFYRKRTEFIQSFENIEEHHTSLSSTIHFYVQKRYETRSNIPKSICHPQKTHSKIKRELQLWRIPVGCSTGKLINKKGRITCTVLKGKCKYESSKWEYAVFDDNDDATWREIKRCDYMRINDTAFSKNNYKEDDVAEPPDAWYEITNVGKSDLLMFVTDAAKTVFL